MPSQRTQYILQETGRIYRQTVTESEIELQPEIMTRFSAQTTQRLRGLMMASAIFPELASHPISVAIREKQVAFTVPLNKLPLRARFSVNAEDKCLVPDFTSQSTPMVLEWYPPSGMSLFLLVSMLPDATISSDQFIVACDSAGRMYRLPTTNCYENCKLCTGKYDGAGATYADAIGKALKQFWSSDWQGDLSDRGGSAGMANSKLMFRFRPMEPEGFEQLPPKATHWTALCTKVSHEYLNNMLAL